MAINLDNGSGATQFGLGSYNQSSGYDFSNLGSLENTLGSYFDPNYDRHYNSYQSALEREYNAEQAQLTRDFNAQEAQKNRDFQMEMSNTAYQRAVEDMKKSGLNPVLAFQQGGASTPTGSMALGSVASSQSVYNRSYSSSGRALNGILNIVSGLIKILK